MHSPQRERNSDKAPHAFNCAQNAQIHSHINLSWCTPCAWTRNISYMIEELGNALVTTSPYRSGISHLANTVIERPRERDGFVVCIEFAFAHPHYRFSTRLMLCLILNQQTILYCDLFWIAFIHLNRILWWYSELKWPVTIFNCKIRILFPRIKWLSMNKLFRWFPFCQWKPKNSIFFLLSIENNLHEIGTFDSFYEFHRNSAKKQSKRDTTRKR